MKVLAIQGSPRKNGNTATLLKHYLLGLEQNHEEVEIKLVNVIDKSINSCTGCEGCKTSKRKCVINDDMQELYPDILETDILVMASPIYWWGITAQAKQFVDRFYALNYNNNFKGKKLVLLTTYGGEDPNSGTEIIKKMFSDICEYLEMDFVQYYGVCSDPLSVTDNKKIQEDIYELGKAVIAG